MRTREEFIDWPRLSRWQPLLSYEPIIGSEVSIIGTYLLNAILDQSIEVQDSFPIRIVIPENYRLDPPRVLLLDHKIPRTKEFHIEKDGKICLGSQIDLKIFLGTDKGLVQFLKHYLDSYFARASLALSKGLPGIEGPQLAHGHYGLKQDLQQRLGLSSLSQVDEAIQLLPLKKREAGERKCPCGCGRKLKKCRIEERIDRIRKMAPRTMIMKFLGL